ncbi:hypothetical protein FQN52_001862 [Onygenales sp. PD_12]|nr:hypothetical protein FQN52_001862 [Onygenales sp. PD_12]
MSLLVQDDIDIGARVTEQPGTPSSQLRRQLSEPPRPPSVSIQPTTAVDASQPRTCAWCKESFQASKVHPTLPSDALKQHIFTAHPEVAKASLLEQDAVDETPAELGTDETGQSTHLETLARQHEALLAERRLESLWNINDARRFTSDYDGEDEDLPSTWKSAFPEFERPKPYETEMVPKGKFLPITKPDIYIDLLKDPESLSTDKLYAMTANAARALIVWQDEWLEIDKLSQRATRQPAKKAANPRKLEDPLVFEDKKEAMLYGYKHDPRETKIGYQDPFIQGGFKPTPTQLKKMKLKAAENPNVDGWDPIIIDGVEYIPGVRPPLKPAPKKKPVDVNVGDANGTTNGVEQESDGRPKRITRFGGVKHPATRETSQVRTEPSSPAATPTPVKGRRPKSRATSVTPQLVLPQQPASPRTSAPIKAPTSAPRPSALKPISTSVPASTAGPRTPTTPGQSRRSATRERTSTPLYEDPLLDPKNQLKIQQSKNPKRTEAMIIHWAKFNHEGRTRNPKRTKAQIEAAKAETDHQGEGSAKGTAGRKRKSESKTSEEALGVAKQAPHKKVKRVAKHPLVPAVEKTEPTGSYPIVHPQPQPQPQPENQPQLQSQAPLPPHPELHRPEFLMGPMNMHPHPHQHPHPHPHTLPRISPYDGQPYQINYSHGRH